MIDRKRVLFQRIILGAVTAGLCAAPLHAQEAPLSPLSGKEITEKQQKSVEKGLAALARLQTRDGSFGANLGRNVGVTSLCAMAFMQAGNLPGRGRYGPNVERAQRLAIANVRPRLCHAFSRRSVWNDRRRTRERETAEGNSSNPHVAE
jgi:hypothetical protein